MADIRVGTSAFTAEGCVALSDSSPHIVYVVAYSAGSGPLLDTSDTPASFLRSSPHASAAPGSSGSHNGCELWQSPESVAEVQSSAPGCSGTEMWRPECMPHGKHAPGSPGTRRADSSPLDGGARSSQFFCEHILQHRLVQAQLGNQPLQSRVFFLKLL